MDIAAPERPLPQRSASEDDVIVRARMPVAARTSAAAASGAPPAASVGLQRTCPACRERYPADRGTRCPACGKDGPAFREALERGGSGDGSFGPEHAGINAGVLGGITMIAIAAIWFGVGYFKLGIIFFYPPVLAVVGVYALIKGLADGNLAGQTQELPRRRSVRRSVRRR